MKMMLIALILLPTTAFAECYSYSYNYGNGWHSSAPACYSGSGGSVYLGQSYDRAYGDYRRDYPRRHWSSSLPDRYARGDRRDPQGGHKRHH